MHSATSRSSQSSLQSSVPNTSTTSSLLHPQQQQQQQQQILYGAIVNPVIPLQPYAPGIQLPCIYPTAQRHGGLSSPVSLPMQGKANRWQFKNKSTCGQQQQQQQQQQQKQQYNQQQQQQQQQVPQQSSYNPKPSLVFDHQGSNNSLPSTGSSFILTSSSFAHAGFPGEPYNNSGVTLIPQTPYLKPPDTQTFCLLQDRQKSQLTQRQPSTSHGSYYNISTANACNLQTVNPNAFQMPNMNPYATTMTSFTSNQISGPMQTVQQAAQIFPSPPIGLLFGGSTSGGGGGGQLHDKLSNCGNVDVSSSKYAREKLSAVAGSRIDSIGQVESHGDWSVEDTTKTASVNCNFERNHIETSLPRGLEKQFIVEKTQEEGACSDESSASFEFTLEAEKMVSALCNTTSSTDLSKEESRTGKSEVTPFFDGAGDNPSNKNAWFANFCTENENSKSIAVQTENSCTDRSQYPELIRKTAYWGCTKAEIVLNSDTSESDVKCDRLINLSSATRTAITKSSTCFPVFAGDRIFAKDLINALLRVSNGWLILDNYLNKQHYPSLAEKLDDELLRCFQTWEENTCDLLRQIVQTFLKLEENSRMTDRDGRLIDTAMSSFPGDVTLYTSVDLFDSATNFANLSHRKETNDASNDEDQRQMSAASNDVTKQQRERVCRKETKLRSKWTITENLTSTMSGTEKSLTRSKSNNVRTGSKFRSKNSSSLTGKLDTAGQSLNAEFFHLRSTVMERNHESSKEWLLKDRKQEFFFDGKIPSNCVNTGLVYGIQRPSTGVNYEQTSVFANNVPRNFNSVVYPGSGMGSMTNVDGKPASSMASMYENKSNIGAPVYIGKSSTDQLELSAVPRNRMTLLSQIEPNMPDKESEEMTANLSAWFASMRNANGQGRVNENVQQQQQQQPQHSLTHRGEILSGGRNAIDFTRQLQIDTNRQLQTLRNMQSIQSAPWNAEHILGKRLHVQQIPEEYDSSEDVRVYMKPGSYNVPKKRHHRKGGRRMDNLRASGNGNKGLHGSRGEKTPRALASSTPVTRTSVSTLTAVVDNSTNLAEQSISLENSPTILKRVLSSKDNLEQDVTWKAACASAEILLEALNVKETNKKTMDEDDDEDDGYRDGKIEKESDREEDDREGNNEILLKNLRRQRMSQHGATKSNKKDVVQIDASSYEASEDDSESTGKLSPSASVLVASQENRNSKTKVKTDSWLIRTLNNASMISKQRRRKGELPAETSESSNSSTMEEERTTCLTSITAVGLATTTITATTTIKDREELIDGTDRLDEIETRKDTEGNVGTRATYSETVRRSTGFATGAANAVRSDKKESFKKIKPGTTSPSLSYTAIVPIPGRKCQRKETPEISYHLLHKSRKPVVKKSLKSNDAKDDVRSEDGFSCLKIRTTGKETSLIADIAGKSQGKKKEEAVNSIGNLVETGKSASKSNDRGWSVWYSSRRKQSLSLFALSKLEAIHRAVWQMDEAWIFKCPPSSSDHTGDRSSSSVGTMEDYCKVIKSPLFLETVGYKIKNRIYHKIEHAVRDFRRIVYNSRVYHKNDNDRVKKIDSLSKRLEDLFEEHFTNRDFGNISGSPREDGSPVQSKFKSTNSQKVSTGRYGNSKKSPSRSTSIMENTSLH